MAFPLNTYLLELRKQGFAQSYVNVVSEYAIELSGKGLPVIFSTDHLAILLGLESRFLNQIIKESDLFYSGFKIRKKDGGERWILAPKPALKSIQRWIQKNILEKIELHECCNGFVRNKSIVTNANYHIDKQVVLNIDLCKFFDSITIKRVYGVFCSLGYTQSVAWDLSALLCVKPPDDYFQELTEEEILSIDICGLDPKILPQGSPASPLLTNIICRSLDKRLSTLAHKLNCSYSRYADDLTFSGDRDSIPAFNTIEKIIKDEGFKINPNKIHYRTKKYRQIVTGIVVNERMTIRKEFRNEVKQHLFFCKTRGVKSHLDFLQSKGVTIKSSYKDWLLGKIFFIKNVDEKLGNHYLELFKTIEWEL